MKNKKLIALSVLSLSLLLPCLSNCRNDNNPTSNISSETPTTSEQAPTSEESSEVTSTSLKDKYECISIEQAIALANEAGTNGTSERYYIYGKIKTISNPTYGEMTIIDENGNELYVYGTYSTDGSLKFNEIDRTPIAGDEVVLHCILSTYNGSPQIKNARLIEFCTPPFDSSDYTSYYISEARTVEANTKVKIRGVVARITFANGHIPNGFFLVDETGSIYVYGTDVAGQVEIGNSISLAGTKVNYGADFTGADKFGYQGAIQVTNSYVLENDNGNTDYNNTWIKESSVKEIIETPLSTNITSDIFKVNALITKQENPGFTNYIISDIDGTTGSYTYTQCNGADFSWLDKFDGKICTVYLSAINCKVDSNGYVYRFIPITVSYDNYSFDTSKANEYALTYHALDQFESSYQSNPKLKVVTSVSNKLLGLENIVLSYSSNNSSIISFDKEDNEMVMNTHNEGTATITITATYNGVSKSESLTITVESVQTYETISILESINSPLNTNVVIKGIVISSLINQNGGFYLSDSTGTVAVKLSNSNDIKSLHIGDEIVISGVRAEKHKYDDCTYCGQAYIDQAIINVNNYGNHDFDKSNVINASLSEVVKLTKDVNVDQTTNIYQSTATLIKKGSNYSTNWIIVDGESSISLYSGNQYQYAQFDEYLTTDSEVKELTIVYALCNWNCKTEYKATIISITYNGTTIYNTYNFTNEG